MGSEIGIFETSVSESFCAGEDVLFDMYVACGLSLYQRMELIVRGGDIGTVLVYNKIALMLCASKAMRL